MVAINGLLLLVTAVQALNIRSILSEVSLRSKTSSRTEAILRAVDASQTCNNYVEFCNRSYGNITEICAHNSPFHEKDNVASNQDYNVITQLNDGIRVLEGQTHVQNGVLHFCHTVCALLDAGPIEDYFRDISQWLSNHPNEVVTLIIANGGRSNAGDFVSPIQNSGLGRYVYTPSKVPMRVSDWPTLGDMIARNTRVVIFMDNRADQATVPYILDQYSHLWQTPISPTNASFPCTLQDLDGLNPGNAADRMYLANHNLNTALTSDILIPDLANINRTNSVSGYGSLGLAASDCAAMWGRFPNILVVDYYNRGSPAPGSVFEAAAQVNRVSYNRLCCNVSTTSALPATTSIMTQATMTAPSTNASRRLVVISTQYVGWLIVLLLVVG